jgi:acetoin utilization protein AcuC
VFFRPGALVDSTRWSRCALSKFGSVAVDASTCSGRVIWDDSLLDYDFGPLHPMAPVRLDLTIRLCRELGLLQGPELAPVPDADDALLGLVHTAEYVEAVRAAAASPESFSGAFGLGTPDVPAFRDMHLASSRVVTATVEAARAVWRGDVSHALSPAGGLHHAMPDHASGFCVYNDVAVAIRWLLDQGAERVAYVDVDVHHGDGVQAVFWDDPRVLTISVHEGPRWLFPGTGWPSEIGGVGAEGTAVNLALPPGTGDDAWLRAIHSTVPHLLHAFGPDVLVSQHGCDTHFLDPLAHLAVSLDGQRMAAQALHGWAHQYAGGRWLPAGGGGYAIVDVVPRCWAHLAAIATGRPLDPSTAVPEGWREYVLERLDAVAPFHLTDGRTPQITDWSRGYDPADEVDQAILATRRSVFPWHGLDPDRD